MIWYWIINSDTGRLLYKVTAATLEDLAVNVPQGCIVSPVEDGQGTETHWFNVFTSAIETVPHVEPDIQVVRAERLALITSARDAYVCAGAMTSFGKVVQTDDVSMRNANGATLAAFMAKMTGQPFSIDWTMADNSVETLNADQMIALGSTMLGFVNAAYARGRVLKDRVLAAADAAAVRAVIWTDTDAA